MSGTREIRHLPLRLIGLRDIPAIPIDTRETIETLIKLGERDLETRQAQQGLTTEVTIGGVTRTGYSWLFGGDPAPSTETSARGGDQMSQRLASRSDLLEVLRGGEDLRDVLRKRVLDRIESAVHPESQTTAPPSLSRPDQFSISWTTFPDVYHEAVKHLPVFAATLTDPDVASQQFFPTIAHYGLAYNLLIARKLAPDDERLSQLVEVLDQTDGANVDDPVRLADQGLLYVIDMTLFESQRSTEVDGAPRFTPSTLTYLQQDRQTKALIPFAVTVAGEDGEGKQHFVRGNATDGAWLYALQAAKASITVYGIWLGHVYHWHIVTAAMQMTMYNNIPEGHPLYSLLQPQSNYLFGFDDVLLALWRQIAPPTSVDGGFRFLQLANQFASGRNYFDDDPEATLADLGIDESDFTVNTPWDRYPIVGELLAIWRATRQYVEVFVRQTYADDQAVVDDSALQDWIKDASNKRRGNVRGLPAMNSRAALARVLTSLLFRVTAHGTGRLTPSSNPALTFVSNYPPCLQNTVIPTPDTVLSTRQILDYLPNLGTIAEMVIFYFTFAFSVPYEPFVPVGGADTDLFFPTRDNPDPADPRNQALVAFRGAVIGLLARAYGEKVAPIYQWPLNIET